MYYGRDKTATVFQENEAPVLPLKWAGCVHLFHQLFAKRTTIYRGVRA